MVIAGPSFIRISFMTSLDPSQPHSAKPPPSRSSGGLPRHQSILQELPCSTTIEPYFMFLRHPRNRPGNRPIPPNSRSACPPRTCNGVSQLAPYHFGQPLRSGYSDQSCPTSADSGPKYEPSTNEKVKRGESYAARRALCILRGGASALPIPCCVVLPRCTAEK